MSARLRETFQRLARQGRTGLIAYVTAGDPDADTTVAVLHALADAGCDVIELGVPFSDPMADGPAIQAAMQRALASGTTFRGTLEMVRRFRERDAGTPIILFGYLNPFFQHGLDAACADAVDAGADGMLVVDLPPEEAAELVGPLRARDLDLVTLYTPTSDEARMATIAANGSGFAYYVSMAGVTGGAVADLAEVAGQVDRVRAATGLPVAVGFGIRTPEQARAVGAIADAVVVGSALIRETAAAPREGAAAAAKAFMAGLRAALDADEA